MEKIKVFLIDPILGDRREEEITSEALLIDTKSWKVVYKGATDDLINFCDRKENCDKILFEGCDRALRSDRSPEIITSEPFGCSISFANSEG